MAFTMQLQSEVVSMCLFHTYEPTLGDQYGGRPAIYQNQQRDRSGSASIWSLPFWSSSFFAHISWVFFSLFPPVYVVLVVFISMQPQVQICSLALFLLSQHKPKFALCFQFL